MAAFSSAIRLTSGGFITSSFSRRSPLRQDRPLHSSSVIPAVIGLNHSGSAVIIPEWLKVAEGAPYCLIVVGCGLRLSGFRVKRVNSFS
jgi:hypothetical protein